MEDVLHWIIEHTASSAEGFTISGGEPFDQSDALHALVVALRSLPSGGAAPDILVYSGYPWRRLLHRHAKVLDCVDVVVSEPYVDGRGGDGLRGSSNQQIQLLTQLARDRYGPWLGQSDRQLQTHFDGQTLRLIGIPRPGDLERIRQRLASAGVSLGECSWLA